MPCSLAAMTKRPGAGFYVTGRVVGIFCNNGVSRREERAYRQGEKITVAVVVEPANNYVERDGTRYSMDETPSSTVRKSPALVMFRAAAP